MRQRQQLDSSDDEGADEENAHARAHGRQRRRSSEESLTTGDWNTPIEKPSTRDERVTEDSRAFVLAVKGLKLFSYPLIFVLLLLSTVVAKVTLLLMSSQLSPNHSTRYCAGKTDNLEVRSPELQRILWSWAITFCFLLPEVLVLLRSMRICIFKDVAWPTFAEFVIPLLCETCHVIGLSLLVFVMLPELDVIGGLMLTHAVFLLPVVLGLLTRVNDWFAMRILARAPARDQNSNIVQARPAGTRPDSPGSEEEIRFRFCAAADFIAFLFLVSGLVIWPVFWHPGGSGYGQSHGYLLPVASLLTSFRWWENYVTCIPRGRAKKEKNAGPDLEQPDQQSSTPKQKFNPLIWLSRVDFDAKSRYVTYLFISVWKCGLFIGCMTLSTWIQGGDVARLFSAFSAAFKSHPINITEIRPRVVENSLPGGAWLPTVFDEYMLAFTSWDTPFLAIGTQMLAAFVAYATAKFACKTGIQKFSFAFPLSLTVPVSLAFLAGVCGSRTENECFWESVLPSYLFWTCPKRSVMDFMFKNGGWVWILWFVAQTWTTRHIWTPTFKRLEPVDELFVAPFYNALLIDQSLALNRRRRPREKRPQGEGDATDSASAGVGRQQYRRLGNDEAQGESEATPTAQARARARASQDTDVDTIPKIKACATLWHEEPEEMMELFKSILRMDKDQSEKQIARELGDDEPDFYEYETHIMFDDAFEKFTLAGARATRVHDSQPQYVLNKYVQSMIETLQRATEAIHGTDNKLDRPKTIPTPYGGRVEWTLPGQTKLYCHLKNKDKIRNKKRWSQVMYMYYLLCFNLPRRGGRAIEQNTFILALDGDINFKPKSVQRLLDLMRKNPKLGAACGRIHPVGSSSLMVWYQKFEYAIGHWFQKATEHVIGCVLCSPGCFSLFRAAALTDVNVLKRYTTEPSEPVHHIQFDQGEDRWLCTLLLKRGWKIEYSAASDSWTHCPEEFNAFFDQRRRWAPSTMANIIDLLRSAEETVESNSDISRPYVYYQIALMVGSILGPGTIFLMLIGAFNAAFRIDNTTALIWNAIPVALFILVCFLFDKKVQLAVAQFLAAIYVLVMVAVVVALLMQIKEDGPLAPSSLFFFGVAASFILAGFLHPVEASCLPYGIVYYITIPTMYMILIIYALMNLHDVSWGTRDAKSTTAAGGVEEGKKQKETGGFFSQFFTNSPSNGNDMEGSFEFSCAGLFKLMCCTKPVTEDKIQLQRIAENLAHLNAKLENSSSSLEHNESSSHTHTHAPSSVLGSEREEQHDGDGNGDEISVDEDIYPKWAEDPALKRAEPDSLGMDERQFWTEHIRTFLTPYETVAQKKYESIKNPEEKKKKIEEDKEEHKQKMLDLRNKMVLLFFMLNAAFVLAIFLLQNNKDTIHIDWPFDVKYNMTYVEGRPEIQLHKEALRLEPIGIVFVFVFAIIMLIQFVSMTFHRFGTLEEILASTDVVDKKELSEVGLGLKLARMVQDGGGTTRSNTPNVVTPQNRNRAPLRSNSKKVVLNLPARIRKAIQRKRDSVTAHNEDNEFRSTLQALDRRRSRKEEAQRRSGNAILTAEPGPSSSFAMLLHN